MSAYFTIQKVLLSVHNVQVSSLFENHAVAYFMFNILFFRLLILEHVGEAFTLIVSRSQAIHIMLRAQLPAKPIL